MDSQKSLALFLQTVDLERSLLIGYYGGGNFGDELLLEVLQNVFHRRGVKRLTISNQHSERFYTYHHDFGYERVDMVRKGKLLKAVLRNKKIIIGGGGLWGLDVNPNVFLLSCMLFFSRFFLGKKVYLLGVGYYSSTNLLGRISAWLAGMAANAIYARDDETFKRFHRINRHTVLDRDIVWLLKGFDTAGYDQDMQQLEQKLPVADRTLFLSLRRFKNPKFSGYETLVRQLVEQSGGKPIILAIMEPQNVDPEGYALINSMAQQYPNVTAIDFSYNPLALLLFFQRHAGQLSLIGPQFHLIVCAAIASVPFLPIAYDNKVSELVRSLGYEPIMLDALTLPQMQEFMKSSG